MTAPSLPVRNTRLVMLFPGQGSQWPGMAAPLLQTSCAFCSVVDDVDAIIQPQLGWRVADELRADESASRLGEILVLQVSLFTVEVALAAVWAELGLSTRAVAGTSLGEIAAARVAGILSLEDALTVVVSRSELLELHRPPGGTVVVNVNDAEVAALLDGLEGSAFVAGYNGPGTITFSGYNDALTVLLERAAAREVYAARVRVEYPAHSPLLEPVANELRARLAPIHPRNSPIPFYSAVTGTVLAGKELDADYWAANLTRPVLGRQLLATMLADGFEAILEVTPHPIFAKPTEDAISLANHRAIHCPTLRRNRDPMECFGIAADRLRAAGVTLRSDP